ncbi:beta/alpha barrel domain-containing protein [Bifidobacterium vespertilionis]|uniref:Diguanylate cyclase n=1 Tax=Bifidobacterium vespertilionis TaxID=2562524 RepID=A0ABQ6SSS5_9BIFI|nr:diguanylate cyclase [Bifidobacterium vespertilionis]KAA8820780.1 diguanylate cyclase [Bifidobacterium vespertilionis]
MSDFEPFYDVNRTYDDNYADGPFGAFAQALKAGDAAGSPAAGSPAESAAVPAGVAGSPASGSPATDVPAGAASIPAGPLLNARYTTAAFRMGFDLAVYKTVRSRAWGCNPFPNVLAVHPKSKTGELTPGSAELDEGVLADTNYQLPISISNSFGVPSRDPDVWQPDMRDAIAAAGPGQLLVPSFQGSRAEGMTREEYIADHVRTARLVCETGAGLMEMNTSCPNEGHNRLLCHDAHLVGEITEAVKNEIGDRPLVVKLAYLPDDLDIERMVRETAARGTVQGFATINTISAKLVDANGDQALPGEGRDRSGVCGAAIRSAGLDMVRRLAAVRDRMGLDFTIVGVGGVIRPDDYTAYREAGADAVMSATGAMWDANLAREIKASLA